MPYLAMMDRLRAFLRKPSALLVICGYSFSDVHVNAVMVLWKRGLKGNATATISFALQHGLLDKYPLAIRLAASRTNLFLLAGNAAIIGRKRANWAEAKSIDTLSFLGIQYVPRTALTDPPHDSELKLGDFEELGKFLERLPGPSNKETTHAD